MKKVSDRALKNYPYKMPASSTMPMPKQSKPLNGKQTFASTSAESKKYNCCC